MTTTQAKDEAFEAWANDADPNMSPTERRQFRDCWQAALAQQAQAVDEAMSLHDRVEFALRDAGFDYDEALRIALLAAAPKQQAVNEAGDESPIYYMRDNHTFKRLSNSVSAALVEIEAEFNAGYTHGMLCSHRSGFKDIHASGNINRMAFLAECRAALHAALPGKTEVDRG